MERWNRAMDAIEDNLEGSIDVPELARLALTSEYHFRRVFSALSGMSLSDYVRRRRLTVATAAVIAGEEHLIDIATRYDYTSADAFTRAFKRMHGVGPAEARLPGARLRSQPRLSFHLTIEGSNAMHYRLVQKEAFRLVGSRIRVPLVFTGPNPAIIDFERTFPADVDHLLAELSDQDPAGTLAVCTDFDETRAEGTEIDYYHAVATSRPVPEGLDSLEVAAGLWVVFESSGPLPESLQQLWPAAYSEWLPANPFRLVEGPEIVRVRLSDDKQSGKGELWLPIETADDRSPAAIS
ncbi:AraC family transcriptional regulator [Gordonia rubripertincta]|uniref:AraC family transcriptional regulator n=1 Tax=Gordonia rubripertincta TaxID=36822 RepID=A0ABT4MY30_GORRU|nr:AraC family transcriptional regulator [Gordonia rubripertincta]MCZ4550946.1 AraC family transcriptional regulator [Gordonia rubripertincta]